MCPTHVILICLVYSGTFTRVKVWSSSSINMIELENKLDIEMKSYLNIRNMIFILIYLFVYHKMYNVNVYLELIILHRTSQTWRSLPITTLGGR